MARGFVDIYSGEACHGCLFNSTPANTNEIPAILITCEGYTKYGLPNISGSARGILPMDLIALLRGR